MATVRTRAAKAAAVEIDGPPDEPDELNATDGGDELVGVVIPAELQFVTPAKQRPVREDRPVPFSIDGEQYTIIAPAKLEETLAPLIAAGARAATESDVLYAGSAFLQRVLAPESLARINRRLSDPADDFELVDLFDQLQNIAAYLIRNAPAAAPASGPVPARRRRR